MKTTNPGTDYAIGTTSNRNLKTGLRFGVISCMELAPHGLDRIFHNGTDLDWRDYQAEVKKSLASALGNHCRTSQIEALTSEAFDAILDTLADGYENPNGTARTHYVTRDYDVLLTGDGDVFVQESPFYTYAQLCSPCAPGACHLRSYLDVGEMNDAIAEQMGIVGNRCHCLGADWFNDDYPCPYPVYSRATGALIYAPADFITK